MISKTKYTFVWLLATLLIVLVFGWLYLEEVRATTITQQRQDMLTLLHEKETQLEELYLNVDALAQQVQQDPNVRAYLSEDASIEEVQQLLFMLQNQSTVYGHLILVDRNGFVLVSPNVRDPQKVSPYTQYYFADLSVFDDALLTPQVTDFSTWATSDVTHQLAAYPIRGTEGLIRAVLLVEVHLASIERLLVAQNTSIWVVDENMHVAQSRVRATQPDLLKTLLGQAERSGEAFEQYERQGKQVFGVYYAMQNYPYILVAERSRSQVFAELERFRGYVLVLLWLAFAVVVLGLNYRFRERKV